MDDDVVLLVEEMAVVWEAERVRRFEVSVTLDFVVDRKRGTAQFEGSRVEVMKIHPFED